VATSVDHHILATLALLSFGAIVDVHMIQNDQTSNTEPTAVKHPPNLYVKKTMNGTK
jgi:hypothetical protein